MEYYIVLATRHTKKEYTYPIGVFVKKESAIACVNNYIRYANFGGEEGKYTCVVKHVKETEDIYNA